MKSRAILPACIDFSDAAAPRAVDFDDVYHPRVGALAQARHVFLAGNGLPGRWQGLQDFTILETGFGLGNNFLATWDAWRRDPTRCQRLHFVSIDLHPPRREDLLQAHHSHELEHLAAELIAAWPPLTADLHPIDLDAARVRLLLAWGDVADVLPDLVCQADAFYLDGFAPARNPRMWEQRVLAALARRARQGATASTWSVARALREGLQTTGFEVAQAPGIGGKREITVARWAPRFVPRRPGGLQAMGRTDVVIVGAGLAGASTAAALAALGCRVTVLDRCPAPAGETSGNPAGLFHGTVHGHDGLHNRLFRSSALLAQREVLCSGDAVRGAARGLLRSEHDLDLQSMQALLLAQGLPADYVRACSVAEARSLAGVPLPHPAWHFVGGGWVSPPDMVGRWLSAPGVRFVGNVGVQSIVRKDSDWHCLDERGHCLAAAPALVLANATDAARLLTPHRPVDWPLRLTRGQVSAWGPDAGIASVLRLPVAGDGYAVALSDGGLLCGATQTDDDDEPGVRLADHEANFARLRRLTGIVAPQDPALWTGRVGWRLQADDRLPVLGALPLWPLAESLRRDQARLLPREPGLFVATALGGRGLTLAPMAGRLLAAQIAGTPWPLEQALADAVDPARWSVRRARRATRP